MRKLRVFLDSMRQSFLADRVAAEEINHQKGEDMKLYVGNLPYTYSEEDLKNLFSSYGSVQKATIVTDRETGQSRGFGFVEMSTRQQGEAAIEGLNGQKQGGRMLVVNEAKPQEKRKEQRPFRSRQRESQA